jgi:hypothetical protein
MTKNTKETKKIPAKQRPGKDSKNSEVGYKKPPKEYQWKKGQSGNPLGAKIRPRAKRELDALLDKIFDEELSVKLKGKDAEITELEAGLRRVIRDKNINGLLELLARRFGKVPDENRNLSIIDDFILENIDLFTDGQIQRIQHGEDKSAVVAEVMRDAVKVLKKKEKK